MLVDGCLNPARMTSFGGENDGGGSQVILVFDELGCAGVGGHAYVFQDGAQGGKRFGIRVGAAERVSTDTQDQPDRTYNS